MRVETRMPVVGNAPTQKPTCEKCRRRAGKNYSFHYGKKKSATTQYYGRRYVRTTSYNVGGKCTGVACDACIRRRRVIEAILPVLGIAAAACFGWWVFFLEGLTIEGQKPGTKWIWAALACLCILIGVQQLYLKLFGFKSGPGDRLIISLKKDELRRQGFDTFWDTDSFNKLR